MSSVAGSESTELTSSKNEMEKVVPTNLNTSKVVGSTSELIITKIDSTAYTSTTSNSNPTLPLKTQVLPVVYIQTPQKIQFPTITKPNNIIVNNSPQIQLASLGTNNAQNKATHNITLSNITVPGNQSVILAPVNSSGKPQQIVIQKPGNILPMVPMPITESQKIAYVTMLKPLTKVSDHTTALSQHILESNLNKSTNQQTCSGQKIVIAPMPKVTTNRLPATVTTNTVQSKFTFMPLIPTTTTENINNNNQKYFNFKISDGQVQSDNTSLQIIPNFTPTVDEKKNHQEASESGSTEKKSEEKVYELSIEEETATKELSTTPSDSTPASYFVKNRLILPKDPPKYPKHGVSILKKNYPPFSERRSEHNLSNNSLLSKTSNNSNSFSDLSKNDMTLTKPSEEQPIVLPEVKVNTQKTERRRKSNFCYRKDYDEMEVEICNFNDVNNKDGSDTTVSKVNDCDEEVDNKDTEFTEIEIIKESSETKVTEDCDLKKLLKWEEGIGTLPGSNIKFILNEFDMIEYVTQDEYNKIIENRNTIKTKDRIQEELHSERQCLHCGCYGMPSEFISVKYCSYDCQEAGELKFLKDKETKLKRKRKKVYSKKNCETVSNDSIKTSSIIEKEIKKDEPSESEEEHTSNENSQDKYSYPWACTKKGFSWSKYLDHVKAKAAPVKLFKDAFPYTRNGFRPGMKLEGVDPQHPSYFCVLTVSEILGYRIRLHFDGYPDNYDFWVNADSMDVFPIGWCEKYGHDLHPPPGYTMENFNWVNYLKQTKSTAAPKHLFVNRAGNAICPNGFRVGMKLEAVDRKNTALVCVASVRDMMDNRILVHFDSWDDIYDYWADPTSPYIHPVGWCDQYGHRLTPPNDYPTPETFTWDTYLKETKTVAAPVRAFKQRPACGFKPGMRLECVDKRVPQLIRVATINDVKDHQIRIQFDGWPDRYSYWVDDDSTDIHPVGWCQKTGHPIEPPLTPDDVYDFLECPTVGCRGQGHIKGPKFSTHSTQKHCPYAEGNIDIEKISPDRLLSPDSAVENIVPVSREPKEKIKPRLGRPPKYARTEIKQEPKEEKPKRKYTKRIKLENNVSMQMKAAAFIENGKIIPGEIESWAKHSKFLKRFVNYDSDPLYWSVSEVSDFISSLPNCDRFSEIFRSNKIDGEALLYLSQIDLIDILNIKIGPAIKIYNSIIMLRQNF